MYLGEDVIKIIHSFLYGICECCQEKKIFYNLYFNTYICIEKSYLLLYDSICF